MKNSLILFMVFLVFVACSPNRKELYQKTDALVQSLQTEFDSYGLLGGKEYSKNTDDGMYTITPIGRLINVKIQKEVKEDEYESLRKDLEDHYKNDPRVNKVYICQAGTVMIDCRN